MVLQLKKTDNALNKIEVLLNDDEKLKSNLAEVQKVLKSESDQYPYELVPGWFDCIVGYNVKQNKMEIVDKMNYKVNTWKYMCTVRVDTHTSYDEFHDLIYKQFSLLNSLYFKNNLNDTLKLLNDQEITMADLPYSVDELADLYLLIYKDNSQNDILKSMEQSIIGNPKFANALVDKMASGSDYQKFYRFVTHLRIVGTEMKIYIDSSPIFINKLIEKMPKFTDTFNFHDFYMSIEFLPNEFINYVVDEIMDEVPTIFKDRMLSLYNIRTEDDIESIFELAYRHGYFRKFTKQVDDFGALELSAVHRYTNFKTYTFCELDPYLTANAVDRNIRAFKVHGFLRNFDLSQIDSSIFRITPSVKDKLAELLDAQQHRLQPKTISEKVKSVFHNPLKYDKEYLVLKKLYDLPVKKLSND